MGRYSRLVEVPEEIDIVPEGIVSRLLDLWDQQSERQRKRELPRGSRAEIIERAKAYAATEPVAVSGAGGHGRCFHVACQLVIGFGLGEEEAFQAIQDWNARCEPPWSEKELRHKLKDADKQPGERGYLLGTSGKAKSKSRGEYRTQDKTDSILALSPIPASLLKRNPEATWIWGGYLARGGTTLFSALWKAGKTTLLAHLLKRMEEDGEFCGLPLTSSKVLYITEESESRWAERRDKLGLKDHLEFLVRPFAAKPNWDLWAELLANLKALQEERKYDLIIFDTLVNLWPVMDENDASQVQKALMPLHKITESSGLLLVHHNRKGDGTEATASRGSGALTAWVDIIIELRRFRQEDRQDKRRVLSAYGRMDGIPDEVVVELTDIDGYVAQGSRNDVAIKTISETVAGLLPNLPPGMTTEELCDKWPDDHKPRRQRLLDALREGADKGQWVKEGDGRKSSPFTFWKPDA